MAPGHLGQGVGHMEAVAQLLHHKRDGAAELERERRSAEHHLLHEQAPTGAFWIPLAAAIVGQ